MNKKMKFLIAGSGGQLAKAFIAHFKEQGLDFFAPDKEQLDIPVPDQVVAAVSHYQPDVLINCAAYNQVDAAQDRPETAFAVNCDAVRTLVGVCKQKNIFMVHFGTNYIFDGEKQGLYTEEDQPRPINLYGESKLKGEEIAREQLERLLIFRLSWVFGAGSRNFLYKLSQWSRGRDCLDVASDEVSNPTFTDDAAKVVLLALEKGLKGTYHLNNTGECSRYEWAKYYFQKAGKDLKLNPVPSSHFALKAKRPLSLRMSNKKICDALDITIPTWQDAVDRFLISRQENN